MLSRLFGGGDPAKIEQKGDDLVARGDHSSALLSFEKALGRSDAGSRGRLQKKIDGCKDALALARLAEAKRLQAQGDHDLAVAELESALEIVQGDEAREVVQTYIDGLERDEAVAMAEDVEVSDEERWMLIAGNWSEGRAEELDECGDELRDALLALHAGDAEAAHTKIEALLKEAEAPRYLWLEVARARLGIDDNPGALEALTEFVDSLAADEIDDAWLAAQTLRARLADDAGDFEGAMECYQTAVEAFDDDPRPYFAMGAFLLEKDCPDEAVDILEVAASLVDDVRPDWTILQELGLAYAAAERPEDAIRTLEQVITFMTENKQMDFPIRTTVALAELHEEVGQPQRAADLWAALTRGSDRENHARYHAEAGRVLADLDLTEEARRMLKRAVALAEDDEEVRADAQATLDALSG